MSADLQAPAFTDDNAAREAMEAIMARWPGMSALRVILQNRQGGRCIGSRRALLLWRVQKSIHSDGRDDFRALESPAIKMVGGCPSSRIKQEGYFLASTTPHARCQLSNSMVHDTS